MAKLNGKKLGLTLGIFFAAVHAIWALLIAISPAAVKTMLDKVLLLHAIGFTFSIGTFNILNAILLVALTFVSGWLIGWFYAYVNNKVN